MEADLSLEKTLENMETKSQKDKIFNKNKREIFAMTTEI